MSNYRNYRKRHQYHKDEDYIPAFEEEEEICVYENGNRIKLDESTSKRNLLYTFNNNKDYVDPYSDSDDSGDDDDDDDKRQDPDYTPEDVKRNLEFIHHVRTGNKSVKNSLQKNKQRQQQPPTKSEVIRDRSLKSMRHAWNEDTKENEFHYVNEQEETTITSRPEYLNFETLIGSCKSMMKQKQKQKQKQKSRINTISVSKLIKGMENRGYEFLKEPLDLRRGGIVNNNNNSGTKPLQQQQQQYRYYRLKSDGILVIVADVQTNNYIGHFYTPKIIDEVASMVEATYRNPDFGSKNRN